MNFIWTFIQKNIDLKKGLIGGILLGTIVWWLNRDAGIFSASTAALKQGLYTFLFGGVIVRISQRISRTFSQKFWAIFWGTMIPACITTFAIFIVHSFKGTPYPLLSTLPTLIMAPPGFMIVSYWEYQKSMDTLAEVSAQESSKEH